MVGILKVLLAVRVFCPCRLWGSGKDFGPPAPQNPVRPGHSQGRKAAPTGWPTTKETLMTRSPARVTACDKRHAVLLPVLAAAFGVAIALLPTPAWPSTPRPAVPTDSTALQRLVVEEALATARVPPSLALAVARVESNFRDDALSSAGARGVMQIMPATARGEYGVGADELWNARLNIQLGIDFLDRLIARYGGRWDLALSHYNGGSVAGEGARARPLAATRDYVDTVLSWERRYREQETLRTLARAAPQDSWVPAQTRAGGPAPDVPPFVAHVRPVTRAVPPPVVPAVTVPAPRATGLDDFDSGMEARRILARARLDDLSVSVRWTGG